MRRAIGCAKGKKLHRLGRAARGHLDLSLIAAIKNKDVLSFVYNGEQRVVEPQTYGIAVSGKRVLRARQIGGGSRSGQSRIAKLFDEEKIIGLRKTGARFERALPEHNPHDSAMAEIFASLPSPKTKRGEGSGHER